MDYQLSRKLKDAGFHQGHPVDHHLGGVWIDKDDIKEYHESGYPDECYVPTLSELIEACGESFESLNRNQDQGWDAWGIYDCCEEHGAGRKILNGDTPEEAVANLWLELNGK